MKSDYWESKNKKPNYHAWLVEWHGCVICACDHGCNQWLAENAGKAFSLLEALDRKASAEELDTIVQKHVSEVTGDIFKKAFEEERMRQKKPEKNSDENKS
jgi:hypothetical protein